MSASRGLARWNAAGPQPVRRMGGKEGARRGVSLSGRSLCGARACAAGCCGGRCARTLEGRGCTGQFLNRLRLEQESQTLQVPGRSAVLRLGPLAPFSGLALAWAVHARITFTVATTVLGGRHNPQLFLHLDNLGDGARLSIGPGLAILLSFFGKVPQRREPLNW